MGELTIHAWMLKDGTDVKEAGRRLRSLASILEVAETDLTTHLSDAGQALGWEGQLVARAEEVHTPNSSLLCRFAQDCTAAGNALTSLGGLLDDRAPTLRSLVQRWETLQSDPPTRMVPKVGSMPDQAEKSRQEDAIRADAQTHMDDLAARDRTTRDTLSRVFDSVMGLVPPGTAPGFTRSQATDALWIHLQQAGVVDTDAEVAVDAQIGADTSPAQVRALLAGMTPEQLRNFLERHPEIQQILAEDWDPADDAASDPDLQGLLDAIGPVGPHGPEPSSVAAIQAYWSSLSAAQRDRLLLLHPTLVGNLDGIPLSDRVGANHLLVRAALIREIDTERALDSGPTTEELNAQRAHEYEDATGSALGAFGNWLARKLLTSDGAGLVVDMEGEDPDEQLSKSRTRIELYSSLLLDAPMIDRTGDTGPVPTDQRLLLVFDPRGDGMIAEWHGRLDATNVGVVVPGTGNDMAGMLDYNTRFAQLVRGHEQDTAVVAWLGSDMPDAVVADAPSNSYTRDSGHRLVRFVEGLGLPASTNLSLVGHSAGGAVVGHADLYGADVDRVLHIASAGTGTDVDDASDYPATTWDGQQRAVTRWSMTAPGDAIEVAQQTGTLGIPADAPIGHGFDPDTTPGFRHLETGRFQVSGSYRDHDKQAGERLEGALSHDYVIRDGTDAWANIEGVITGGSVIPYQTRMETRWVFDPYSGFGTPIEVPVSLYDDPDHPGTDPVPLDQVRPN